MQNSHVHGLQITRKLYQYQHGEQMFRHAKDQVFDPVTPFRVGLVRGLEAQEQTDQTDFLAKFKGSTALNDIPKGWSTLTMHAPALWDNDAV